MDIIYAVISSIMQSEVLTGLIHPESSAQVQYIDANQGVMGLKKDTVCVNRSRLQKLTAKNPRI